MTSTTPPFVCNDIRSHVVTVAAKAFLERGVKSVTMDDIAHLLSMSKRTLYQLFKDKEDLLLACMRMAFRCDSEFAVKVSRETDNVLEVFLRIVANKMKTIGAVSPAYFIDILKYPRIMELQARYKRKEIQRSIDFFQKGIEQGLFRKDVEFDIVCPLIQGYVDFVMNNEEFRDYNMKKLFANTVILALRGCATPKGMLMIDDFMDKV